MTAHGSNELLSAVINRNLCIGCGACVNLCPYFKSFKGTISQLFPCNLEEGRCYANCPKVAVDLNRLSESYFHHPYTEDPLGTYESIHIAWAGGAAPRGGFQSGGTVSALMSFAIEESLVDAAVLTDRVGLEPIPRTVTSPDDVLRCAASKYTAAPTIAEVNAALKADHAAIGVVATPCQALALAQMRTNSSNEGDTTDKIKLVIGLFCTWALDYRSLESFFSERVKLDTIKKIDIPPPPAEVMVVENSAGTMEIPLSEIREMIPDSCRYCIDMTGEFSDVSVGVLEGEPTKNTLIVRTSLGRELVEKATRKGYLHTEPYPEEALEHLRWAAGRKKRRAVTLLDESELLSEDTDEKLSVLKMSKKVVESIVKRSS